MSGVCYSQASHEWLPCPTSDCTTIDAPHRTACVLSVLLLSVVCVCEMAQFPTTDSWLPSKSSPRPRLYVKWCNLLVHVKQCNWPELLSVHLDVCSYVWMTQATTQSTDFCCSTDCPLLLAEWMTRFSMMPHYTVTAHWPLFSTRPPSAVCRLRWGRGHADVRSGAGQGAAVCLADVRRRTAAGRLSAWPAHQGRSARHGTVYRTLGRSSTVWGLGVWYNR